MGRLADFYVEGSTIRVICINRNVRPFHGKSFWVDSMNMTVGKGGVLEFNATRNKEGLYTCGVKLNDPTVVPTVPTRSFTLVVNCKF